MGHVSNCVSSLNYLMLISVRIYSNLLLLGCFLHRKTFHISLEHIFTNDIFGLLKGSRHDGFSGSSSWIYSLWNLLTI